MADDGNAEPLDGAPKHVVEQLLSKSWDELEVLEHAGYLLFPDFIYKRKANGEFEEIKVLLRVPRQHEMRKARVQARAIARQEGLDFDRDKDLVGDLETICILSMAIRNSAPPYHEPMVPDPLELEKLYDRPSLMQIWAKLDELHRLVDPASHAISEEEIFAVIAAIAKGRTIAPLFAYAAHSQTNCIIFMASLLQQLKESESSSESSDS